VEKKTALLPFHPLAEKVRPLTEKQFADLVASIKKHGLLIPIKTWTDSHGKTWIVDGIHRSRACPLAGVEPDYFALAR